MLSNKQYVITGLAESVRTTAITVKLIKGSGYGIIQKRIEPT